MRSALSPHHFPADVKYAEAAALQEHSELREPIVALINAMSIIASHILSHMREVWTVINPFNHNSIHQSALCRFYPVP